MGNSNGAGCVQIENMKVDEVPLSQEQYKNIFYIQKTILEKVAERGSSASILDQLCKMAESLLPNSVASIMLKDKTTGLMDMIHAPSVPPEGIEKFKGLKPGPHAGSCGNAIYKNEPQFVSDTLTDRRWEDIRTLAYDFNLCSCWSVPVRDENKEAIGTFALSSFEHRSPSQFHKLLLETASHIVSIVLKNAYNEKRIQILTKSMENANEGVIITDDTNNIIEINKRFLQIYGYKEEDVLGKNPRILSSGLYTQAFYEKMWQDIHKKGHWAGEITNVLANGENITQWVSISSIRNEDGTKNYLAIFTDLTELKEAQEQANYLAYHDPLTGLYNKSKLDLMLKSGVKYSLIHIDINNFNYINVAYGFDFGDTLLQKIAEVLVRECGAQSVFRINSDEFALLYTQDIDLVGIIQKTQKYFYEHSFEVDNVLLNVSMNYGADKGGNNLLENASLALKISKKLGKNRFHLFDSTKDLMEKDVRNNFITANHLLLQALEEDNVVPYFQGIYDNKAGEITKYEALVRIEANKRVIAPFEFLDTAQLSGLLPQITKRMIDKTFRIMQHRKESFSLNITEDDLGRNYLIAYFEKKLQEYALIPQQITLEILEGISAHGKSMNVAQLRTLKAMGFSLAIDDFGAEYSNFERILDLEIDYLKIDAKYIKNIDTDTKSYEIVKSIANFAKNAGIVSIAEFVHSESVQKKVIELGIDYSQGYHFSEPHKIMDG